MIIPPSQQKKKKKKRVVDFRIEENDLTLPPICTLRFRLAKPGKGRGAQRLVRGVVVSWRKETGRRKRKKKKAEANEGANEG